MTRLPTQNWGKKHASYETRVDTVDRRLRAVVFNEWLLPICVDTTVSTTLITNLLMVPIYTTCIYGCASISPYIHTSSSRLRSRCEYLAGDTSLSSSRRVFRPGAALEQLVSFQRTLCSASAVYVSSGFRSRFLAQTLVVLYWRRHGYDIVEYRAEPMPYFVYTKQIFLVKVPQTLSDVLMAVLIPCRFGPQREPLRGMDAAIM